MEHTACSIHNNDKYEFYITEIFISNAFAVCQHSCGLFQQRPHR